MPELDIRKKYTYGYKLKQNKKKNLAVDILSGIFPWKDDTASDIVRKVVFLTSVSVLALSTVLIVNYYFGEHEEGVRSGHYDIDFTNENKVGIKIPGGSGLVGSTGTGELQEVDILEKYKDLYELNHEFVGHIMVGSDIDYPVPQSKGDKGNDFYLKYDFEGRPTPNGTVFACKNGEFSPPSANSSGRPNNILLYGHNLRTRNNFAPLTKYRDNFDYLKDNYIIRFDTLYEPGKYLVFAVYQTNVFDRMGEFYDYASKNNFGSRDEFYEYVTEALDRSRYHTGVDLKYGDELLTLTTCDFSFCGNPSDVRVVVVARRVRPGESLELDTDNFVSLFTGSNPGRNEDGTMRYKMFDYFYTYLNSGKDWGGREWDTSVVDGLDEYLSRTEKTVKE